MMTFFTVALAQIGACISLVDVPDYIMETDAEVHVRLNILIGHMTYKEHT